MRFTRFLLAAALVLVPGGAAAQPSTSPPLRLAEAAAVSEAEMRLATRLLELIDMKRNAAVGIRLRLNEHLLADPELAPYGRVLEEWTTELFDNPEATEAYARMYAERFTEREMREIVAFYESPTGRRLAVEQLRVLEQWAAEQLDRPVPEALERMYAERFTEGEMREMAAFFASPTGRRLAGEQQGLIHASEQIVRQLSDAGKDNLMDRLHDAMEEASRPPKAN